MRSSSVAIHCRPIRYRRSRATGCCVEMTMKTCSRIWRKSSLRYWSWVRTFSAALPSRLRRASSEASIWDSTSVPIRTNNSRRLASSRSKVSRGIQSLTEPAGDVGLSPLVLGLVEEVGGGRELDQLPVALLGLHEHEGGEIRHARGLLHVVSHDHDGEVARERRHQVLDLQRRHRVQGRARLVHEDHLRADRDAARDGEPLLLATGQRGGGVAEAVLHLVEQSRPLEAFLDRLSDPHLLPAEEPGRE